MGTRQVRFCWSELGYSISGYSSMSLVSASSGHAEGTACCPPIYCQGAVDSRLRQEYPRGVYLEGGRVRP